MAKSPTELQIEILTNAIKSGQLNSIELADAIDELDRLTGKKTRSKRTTRNPRSNRFGQTENVKHVGDVLSKDNLGNFEKKLKTGLMKPDVENFKNQYLGDRKLNAKIILNQNSIITRSLSNSDQAHRIMSSANSILQDINGESIKANQEIIKNINSMIGWAQTVSEEESGMTHDDIILLRKTMNDVEKTLDPKLAERERDKREVKATSLTEAGGEIAAAVLAAQHLAEDNNKTFTLQDKLLARIEATKKWMAGIDQSEEYSEENLAKTPYAKKNIRRIAGGTAMAGMGSFMGSNILLGLGGYLVNKGKKSRDFVAAERDRDKEKELRTSDEAIDAARQQKTKILSDELVPSGGASADDAESLERLETAEQQEKIDNSMLDTLLLIKDSIIQGNDQRSKMMLDLKLIEHSTNFINYSLFDILKILESDSTKPRIENEVNRPSPIPPPASEEGGILKTLGSLITGAGLKTMIGGAGAWLTGGLGLSGLGASGAGTALTGGLGAGAALTSAAGVGLAGAAGYGAGTLIDKGMTASGVFGKRGDGSGKSMGEAIYDKWFVSDEEKASNLAAEEAQKKMMLKKAEMLAKSPTQTVPIPESSKISETVGNVKRGFENSDAVAVAKINGEMKTKPKNVIVNNQTSGGSSAPPSTTESRSGMLPSVSTGDSTWMNTMFMMYQRG